MAAILKKYRNKHEFSYTIGVFPTLELLKSKPEIIKIIYLRSSSKENKGVDKIISICKRRGIKYQVSDKAISKVSRKGNVFAVTVFKKYESRLKKKENHVVLVKPETAGNIGTIIRTMIGLGVRNLGIVKPAVDIFNPELIRASMGSLFKIDFQYFNSFREYSRNHRNNNYVFMLDGEQLLPDVKFQKPFALVFGSESSGLASEYRKYGITVKIPQIKEIDSFNLAISVGIALYSSMKS